MTLQLHPDETPLNALRWAAHACADSRLSLAEATVAVALADAKPDQLATTRPPVPTPVRTDEEASDRLELIFPEVQP